MWKPDESLNDFTVRPDIDGTVEAPRKVSLRPTNQVEILKPLAPEEVPTTTGYGPNARKQPLWFRRLIAVGSGILVMLAFVLISAILIGITEPAAGPEVTTNGHFEDNLTPTDEQPDIFSPPT